jgi:protein disulfide-isomerase
MKRPIPKGGESWMRWTSLLLTMCLVACFAGCGQKPRPASQTHAIAWREGDVDDALAEARESGKPVMLYWGAKWCPPCNQIKSTLFKDPAFIAETDHFIPVHLDGDSPGAQRWGERFGISGYPTVIVLRPDGSEVTRLSSGAADRLPAVLGATAGRTTSIEALFDKAGKDPSALSPDEWRLLAAFDWENDPKHFADHARAGRLLEGLSAAAPNAELKRRFALLALAVEAQKGPDGKYSLTPAQQARLAEVLPAILANTGEVITNRQELSDQIPDLVAALPDAALRAKLGASLTAALDQVYRDVSLPLPDRLTTVNADIILAKAGDAPLPPAVLAKVRERVAWVDRTATDAMVRQSVISDAAGLLHDAGDDAGAKRLLEAELKRSAFPYYYMLDLAGIAEDEKDGPAAIAWARKAYDASQGPATRVQWAIDYSKVVLRQAPGDTAAVETSAIAVIDELAKDQGGYYQRTRVKVARWGALIRAWSDAHGGGAVLRRLDTRMAAVCARQADAQGACLKWSQAA